MLDRLAEVEKRYQQLESLLTDPQLRGKQREYTKVAKERAELEEIVSRYREWKKIEQEIQENRELLNEKDDAIRELAKEEMAALRARKEDLENRLKVLILPKDPNDSKNVILEIRAGTGGEEAALKERLDSSVSGQNVEVRFLRAGMLRKTHVVIGGSNK